MPTGMVRWFENKRGVGFIRQDNGNDIFVNMEAVEQSGMTTLKRNQRLSFDVHRDTENNKAAKAVNLKEIT